MASGRIRLLLLAGLLLTDLQAQFLLTATPTVTLSMSSVAGSTPMNIAWHPVYGQYYGGRGGNSSYGGIVWSTSGAVLQNLAPINTDLRSFFYNLNTGNLENVTYAAYGSTSGYRAVLLNGSGLFTGNYTNVGVTLSGLADSQVAPAYDAARNLLYAYASGNTVTVVSPATGLAVNSITLDLTAAGSPVLPSDVIGYDAINDALISYTTSGGARALAFNATTGAFLASVTLPALTESPSNWRMGYANDQLFIYNGPIDSYQGFAIAAIPEPGTLSLLATGLIGFGLFWRRRSRS
jgi:hypothetical protein